MNKSVVLRLAVFALFVVFSDVEARRNSNFNYLQNRRNLEENCIVLKDCPELLWLLQNKHDVPGMSFQEVLQYLQDQLCGYDGNDPKVKCNIAEDEMLIADPENQIITSFHNHQNEMHSRMGGVIDVRDRNTPVACSGSITIIHYDRVGSQQGNPLKDLKALKLRGKSYKRLTGRLTNNREVIRIKSEGNCCWKLFSQTGHRGEVEMIHQGFDSRPGISIKSASRTSC